MKMWQRVTQFEVTNTYTRTTAEKERKYIFQSIFQFYNIPLDVMMIKHWKMGYSVILLAPQPL